MPATRSGWRRAAGWPPNSRASGRSRRRRIRSCPTWRGRRSGHCEAGLGDAHGSQKLHVAPVESAGHSSSSRAELDWIDVSVGPPGPGSSGVGASAAAESTPPLSPRSAVGLKLHRPVLRYSPAIKEHSHFKRWGAAYLLLALFLASWAAQFVAMLVEIGNEAQQLGQPFSMEESWPRFFSATFENWQSEWLQLLVQAVVLLGMKHVLFQGRRARHGTGAA